MKEPKLCARLQPQSSERKPISPSVSGETELPTWLGSTSERKPLQTVWLQPLSATPSINWPKPLTWSKGSKSPVTSSKNTKKLKKWPGPCVNGDGKSRTAKLKSSQTMWKTWRNSTLSSKESSTKNEKSKLSPAYNFAWQKFSLETISADTIKTSSSFFVI